MYNVAGQGSKLASSTTPQQMTRVTVGTYQNTQKAVAAAQRQGMFYWPYLQHIAEIYIWQVTITHYESARNMQYHGLRIPGVFPQAGQGALLSLAMFYSQNDMQIILGRHVRGGVRPGFLN